MLQLLAKREAGDTVTLELVRGRRDIAVDVVLMKRAELFKVR